MTDDLIKKRFVELSHKANEIGIFLFSDFLGLAEQNLFHAVIPKLETPFTLFGGVEGCERVMARFGSEEALGYAADFPIVCLKAEPKDCRFAEKLTHRDYLGALMNLGIERDVLGDLVICGDACYIFCAERIAPFIAEELRRVRHTDIRLTVTEDIPTGDLFRTEKVLIQCSGERLDAVIAKVLNLSRDDALDLFRKRLVYVNGKEMTDNACRPKRDDVISVRGYGRMIYDGYETLSRKGKLNITVRKYV